MIVIMNQLPQLQSLEGGKKQKKTKKPKVRNPVDKLKFVEARARGLSKTQAAFEASGATTPASAATIGGRLEKDLTIQQAVAEAMQRAGLTIDKVIAPVAEAMQANQTATFKGTVYTSDKPDHSVRLKAAGMAQNLMGLTGNNEGSGNTFNFVQVTNVDKDQYAL